ncbi:DeoR/GlpR family DNA-binding transcription regulator [Conexibacter stalactiti]|uniref:DeoR/GlpR family DNA-binding transcription regulator n=1 Tax=Conexibacter stalactiti TaxID=1940611 RepID=A0ABU4HWB2_9ACTN|nr:DeoR/GlpR family DNA-binding transcription regulator [Conexibacter stalactiti]MDW5597566.1 DeoR/GlpR family DNA-binding transcription regulator [Conexibacter stalactiti]MEC5038208.1 DeoR/GlpR family DNA-binding transcription regulator [Conexibacter stalactiti]
MPATAHGRLRSSDRRLALERLLRTAGTLTLADAHVRFDVSPMTIRRDFDELERRRVAVRTHGGIVLRSLLSPAARAQPPDAAADAALRGIAEHAVDALRPDETIFLDGGPLAVPIAAALIARNVRFAVVTTSLPATSLLSRHDSPPAAVTLAGGDFDPASRSFVGPTALAAIARHYADRALVSVGEADADPRLADVTRAMVDHARDALTLTA